MEDYDEFMIEKICGVRLNSDGYREYLVQWKDFLSQESTWESEFDINCPRLVAKFKSEVISPGSSLTEVSSSTNSLSTSLSSGEEHRQSDETESVALPIRYSPGQSMQESETESDDNNYPPEGIKILGVTKNDEHVFLRIKRKGAHREEWVPSQEINLEYPQLVIRFYEDLMEWDFSSD